MFFFFSLLPATIFAVLGYIVLYCALRSTGGVSTFGKGLAVWAFALAILFPLTGAYFSIAGISPFEEHFQEMQRQYRQN